MRRDQTIETIMTDKIQTDHAFTTNNLHGRGGDATYAGALSFARRRYSRDLSGVDVAVTGVPFDTATTNRPGARFGPRALRSASSMVAAERRPWPWKHDPLSTLAVVDYGDCPFDFGRPEQVPGEIRKHVAAIITRGAATLTLGGDHFVTYPVLQAYAEKYGALSLLHFDAHHDTWRDEAGRIDHGTMFFHAANDGTVDPGRSAQVGLRTPNDDLMGFNILDARFVHNQGVAAVCREVKRAVGDHPVYLTFDIDCLDPCFAPGTGTPVCGGLSTFQALEIIRGLSGINLVGMDVMEVAPAYDVGEISALAGATLAMEMLCLYAAGQGKT